MSLQKKLQIFCNFYIWHGNNGKYECGKHINKCGIFIVYIVLHKKIKPVVLQSMNPLA